MKNRERFSHSSQLEALVLQYILENDASSTERRKIWEAFEDIPRRALDFFAMELDICNADIMRNPEKAKKHLMLGNIREDPLKVFRAYKEIEKTFDPLPN